MNYHKFNEGNKDIKKWNNRAYNYDNWYKTFQGAVENYVDWILLKPYLPKDKKSKILDAAGGTGRITLPLAKMGYSVTLCDISPKMLKVAREKLLREGIIDNVEIYDCDVRNLNFPDDSFDFVLCWDGIIEDTIKSPLKELIRVTKKGGKISIFLVNKWASAINSFYNEPGSTLSSINSLTSYIEDDEGKHRIVSVEETSNLFQSEGIKIIDIYAVCGWMKVLNIPEKILESQEWDETFFNQTTEIVLKLSKEPSVKGISRHLVVYGEKK